MSLNRETQKDKKVFPFGTIIGEDGKDSYVIQEATSSGGEAIVYKAIAKSDGRVVALKLLYVLTDPTELSRFLRVKEIHTRVRGVNVLPLLQAGIFMDGEDKYPYFVTPFFSSGTTLQDILNNACKGLSLEDKHVGTLIPYPDLLHYALQVGNGLLSLHSHDVMHRDVKPSNILIAGEGTAAIVRLMDLGLSKLFKQEAGIPQYKVTQLGDIKGTPSYMAPESVAGKPSMLADIWAFGAVVYELVTGRTVFNFESGNMLSIMRKVAGGELMPTPITEYSESVDPDLVTLIMKCLENDPALRPQSMLDVLDELNKLQLKLGHVANSMAPRSSEHQIDPGAETMAAPQTPQKALSVKDLNRVSMSSPSVVIRETPMDRHMVAPKIQQAKTVIRPVSANRSKTNRSFIGLAVMALVGTVIYFGYTIWTDNHRNVNEIQRNATVSSPVQIERLDAPRVNPQAPASSSVAVAIHATSAPSATIAVSVATVTAENTASAPSSTKSFATPPKTAKTKRTYGGAAPLPQPGIDYVPGNEGF